MKQFSFLAALFITLCCASMTEARVQRATRPSARLWSQPFIRPQFFNVRQVLEKTNGDLYSHDDHHQDMKEQHRHHQQKSIESIRQPQKHHDDNACKFVSRQEIIAQPFLDCIA
ncbi:unnamed protein product [Cylindrotheca closterium]|uniref:Uncharacterized protein n=1 Tax=Cylindrotheca closterium TaxID=2856 RepID=A0AAD2CVR5_9STRA|nr:unnamed protein product [Cylindrotheca closterium]